MYNLCLAIKIKYLIHAISVITYKATICNSNNCCCWSWVHCVHMWANNLHLFMLYLRQLYSIDLQLIGVVNKTHSWTLLIYLRHSEASFSPISIVSLHLRVAQMPRSYDLAIFVRTTDRWPFALPLAHARGVIVRAYRAAEGGSISPRVQHIANMCSLTGFVT